MAKMKSALPKNTPLTLSKKQKVAPNQNSEKEDSKSELHSNQELVKESHGFPIVAIGASAGGGDSTRVMVSRVSILVCVGAR